jgi:alcohol dehydrogenase class IV
MVAEAMGCGRTGIDAVDASAVVERLRSLVTELNIPTSLERFGVGVSDLDMLTDAAYGVRRLLDNNPIEMDKNDIKAIYREVI